MISRVVIAQNLRTVTNRISSITCRNKSTETYTEDSDPDLPTVTENPFKKERKLCILCKYKIEPDYKNVRLLSQFQSTYTGRIYDKHITGLCDHKQKRIQEETKKAQQAGLMGFMTKDPKFVRDPELFNPNFPFKPHPY